MPGRVQKLGDYEFTIANGLPVLPASQLEILSRPGVAGHAFWDLGQRGLPFPLVTLLDVLTIEEAYQTYADYRSLIAGDPIELTWEDIDLTQHQTMVKVLAVEPLQIKQVLITSGGKTTGSQAICRVRWTLLAVPQVASEPNQA